LGIAPSSSSTPSPAAAASKPNKAGKGAKDDEDGSLMEMRERVERTIEINATPEEVFEIATDFKNYPVRLHPSLPHSPPPFLLSLPPHLVHLCNPDTCFPWGKSRW
jgi:hypothetical protein